VLSRKQIALIHVACKELGISEDDRHLIQEEFTGFRSLTKMNYQAWCRLVHHLQERGFKSFTVHGSPFSDGQRTTDNGQRNLSVKRWFI